MVANNAFMIEEMKALIISKAAGVKLGEIISIDYSWSEINLV